MTNKDFDIDAFIDNIATQAQDIFPDDIGNKTQTFIEKMFDKFLRMTNEAIDNNYSDAEFSVEDKVLLLQVIAEWTFHKTIDLDRAKLPFEFWESILQKIAFAVFDVFQNGVSANCARKAIIMGIEYHVNQMYNSSLQELFEKGVINKETLEKAQKESNVDKMSEEYQQNEASEKENDITDTSLMGRLKSILQSFFK